MSHAMRGHANQRAKTLSLTSGVATETAAMPSAVSSSAPRAQPTARRCSSPSVRAISQPAPSSA